MRIGMSSHLSISPLCKLAIQEDFTAQHTVKSKTQGKILHVHLNFAVSFGFRRRFSLMHYIVNGKFGFAAKNGTTP